MKLVTQQSGAEVMNEWSYTSAPSVSVAYPGILFEGVQQIQLRTEDGDNGDLGGW